MACWSVDVAESVVVAMGWMPTAPSPPPVGPWPGMVGCGGGGRGGVTAVNFMLLAFVDVAVPVDIFGMVLVGAEGGVVVVFEIVGFGGGGVVPL